MSTEISTYSKEELLKMLETMQLIRSFEEKAGMMYGLRKIGGFCHLYTGQEAVAGGAITALDLERDYVVTAYRDHGHALACGMDPKKAMAELFGKVTGCSHGKGGSMHFFDVEHHFMGGNGIVGAQIPVAAGVAFAQQYRGSDGVTLCFFGDGAFHQGAVHETFNLAKIWNLPIVFIVENNQWGMGTNWKRVSAVSDFSRTASAYGMKGYSCDGLDVIDVRSTVAAAVADARRGKPSFIEARTYRYKGHSMSDPQKYRTREEIDEYRKRDALQSFAGRLVDAGIIAQNDVDGMVKRIETQIEDAVAFAEQSPEPSLSELYTDIYA